jgi:hypothetical protein
MRGDGKTTALQQSAQHLDSEQGRADKHAATERKGGGEAWAARANVAIGVTSTGWLGRSATGKCRSWDATARCSGRCSQAEGGADTQTRRAVVLRVAASAGAIWGRAVWSCRIRSRQQSDGIRRAREQRGRNVRSRCRVSAGVYATMHPQCTKGPGPGGSPGTRAFDGGGVER